MINLDVFIANASGNTTAFVLTPTDRKFYTEVAKDLMTVCKVEQSAFVKNTRINSGDFDMAGMEFCGNATRSFAGFLHLMHMHLINSAEPFDDGNPKHFDITISDKLVKNCTSSLVDITPSSYIFNCSAPLPLPQIVFLPQFNVVDFPGISHVIVPLDFKPDFDLKRKNIKNENNVFNRCRHIFNYANRFLQKEAFGILFFNDANPDINFKGLSTKADILAHLSSYGCPLDAPLLKLYSSVNKSNDDEHEEDDNDELEFFYNKIELLPVVNVNETGSTICEKSCGSGAGAIAFASVCKNLLKDLPTKPRVYHSVVVNPKYPEEEGISVIIRTKSLNEDDLSYIKTHTDQLDVIQNVIEKAVESVEIAGNVYISNVKPFSRLDAKLRQELIKNNIEIASIEKLK